MKLTHVRINGESFISAEDGTLVPVIMKVTERYIRDHAPFIF